MRSEKSRAVAQIVSAILAKPGTLPVGAGRPMPNQLPEGFSLRLEEGRIFLYDAVENKMTLEELIQYVERYLA